MAPELVSHYRVLQKLGAGGMGEVYLAEDLILHRRVALKFLPPDLASDRGRISRFEREARAISALNHPNILTIYELGSEQDVPFIVTEYVEGETLRDRIDRGIPLRDALEIAIGLATGLSAAHRAGIVHRDLKPENVIIRGDGVVKILDFGLATLAENITPTSDTAPTSERPGVAGTLPYMSPEQLRGETVTTRTDVYSFGAVLFEMVSGHLPFRARTNAELVAAILEHAAPPLSRLSVDVPAALERLVSSSLAKEASERPGSIDDVLSVLREIRRSLHREPRISITATGQEPPVRAMTNLPAQITPLVGRDAELDQLQQLLHDEGIRLVTITGAGGTGKTRLAIAAAHRLRDEFPHGVFLISLAAVTDASLVPPTIAQVVGVKEVPGENLLSLLQSHFAGREILLVMDNFEQVRECAAMIADLLSAAPGLKILITSQVALRMRGEREFPLHPLPLDPAVALFLARAKDVAPGFEQTGENGPAILEICRRLDGLPLAIELAAARMRVLSPSAVLRKLDQPLALLTGGPRDLPLRQQTMRNAIEWSYSHLTSAEQTLFRRLAVFSGGCTAVAVQRICGSGLGTDDEVLETFTSLVDKSLLRREHPHAGDPRFLMLETIRSFALELLAASAETDDLRRRHLSYFVSLAGEVEPELQEASGALCLAALDRELHNIRAALQWSVHTAAAEQGLRLAASLLPFWLRRGHLSEGRQVLTHLLQLPEGSSGSFLRALYAAGVLAEASGDFAEARRYLELNLEGQRQRGDAWGVANALNNLGVICLRQKEYDSARALYQESIELWRQLGYRPAVALALQNIGNIARLQGDYEQARRLYEQSAADFREMSDEVGVARCLNLLGDVAREEGKLDQARRLVEQSLQTFMRLTEHRDVAMCLGDLGRIEHESHNFSEAFSLYQESLLIFRELGDALGAAGMLDALAILAADQSRHDDAVGLAAASSGLRRSAGARLPDEERGRVDRLLEEARQSLGDARAAELWRAGEALSLDQAVALTQR